MSNNTRTRHAYVAFYPSDWLAGVSGLPRVAISIYFDICLYNWDKARPMPRSNFDMITMDMMQEAQGIVEMLIDFGKIKVDEKGALFSERAISEGEKALKLWEAKSKGGRNRQSTVKRTVNKTVPKSAEKSAETIKDQSSSTGGIEKETEREKETDKKEVSSTLPKNVVVVDDSLVDSDDEAASRLQAVQAKTDLIRAHMLNIPTAWNTMALSHGLTEITTVSDKRGELMRQVLLKHDLDTVLDVIRTIPESPFLLGANDKMGPVRFDWAMKNFDELLDGSFHPDGEKKNLKPVPVQKPVRHVEAEGEIGGKVRASLIKSMGDDAFAWKYRGMEFHQNGNKLVVAAISSGMAQDLVIAQKARLLAVAKEFGLSDVTHSSLAAIKKDTNELDEVMEG